MLKVTAKELIALTEKAQTVTTDLTTVYECYEVEETRKGLSI